MWDSESFVGATSASRPPVTLPYPQPRPFVERPQRMVIEAEEVAGGVGALEIVNSSSTNTFIQVILYFRLSFPLYHSEWQKEFPDGE